jgi:multiple sugar transport system ATP-binding protein
MGQLAVKSIVKHLGNNLIVDKVSFSVNDGEFFVLVGPSGCGKSTLLRIISGLEQAESGELIMDSRNITSLPPRERNLAMVFQDYGLYPNMNVYDNIAYGLQTRGVNQAEIQFRISTAAEKLGLTPYLGSSVVDLSGGEQQRVALARAMVKDADAYLYDEPLSNLDPKLRNKARRDIVEIHRQKQKPSIYVTHDQAEALAMGDRIAVMGGGKLQQVGTAEQLINQPQSMFVAGFIGSPPVNLIPGYINHANDGYHFMGDGLALPLPEKWNALLGSLNKSSVIAGIRPDTLVQVGTHAEFEVNAQNTITGAVSFVEPLLGETIVSINIGEKTSITAALQDMLDVAEGDSLSLAIDPDRILLFDPTTEQSLMSAGY